MHLITITDNVYVLGSHYQKTYSKGDQFLVDDVAVGGIMGDETEIHTGDDIPRMLGQCARANYWPIPRHLVLDPAADYNGRSILLMRGGGFGDLMFLTPVIREIKRRWPTSKIYVSCMDRYKAALENNPDVEAIFEMPLPVSGNFLIPPPPDAKVPTGDIWAALVSFENVIETNPEARTMHAVDCCAERAGIELPQDGKRMHYFISADEQQAAGVILRSLGIGDYPHERAPKKIIGIQYEASSHCRTYPGALNGRLLRLLINEGYQVLLFGAPGLVNLPKPVAGVISLPALPAPPSFRVSCAILMHLDLLIAPDSSLAHVAGALEVPTIALHGAFPGDLRHRYHKTTYVMEGNGQCGPCFHHQKTFQHWPAGGPCNAAKMCVLMAMISPEKITRTVQALMVQKAQQAEAVGWQERAAGTTGARRLPQPGEQGYCEPGVTYEFDSA